MSVSFCLPHPVAVSAFMICRGLCACTEMLWMCVLYVSFGSKVRPRTFRCVAMGSVMLFILRSRLLSYPSVLHGTPHIRLIICISAFSIFNPVKGVFDMTKLICHFLPGVVGLGVGSWPSNRTNTGSPPSAFAYTS